MSMKELVEKLNEIAPKIREYVENAKKEALSEEKWANIRLYTGESMQVLISVSPNGVVMLRICTRNIRNCVKLTRDTHLDELTKIVAIIGNSKAFEVIKQILAQNPQKAGSINIALL